MTNRIIRNIIATAVLPIVCSCSWTEPESLSIVYPSIEKQNPELYGSYCLSLREYRKSEHKIMIAKFDNKPYAPSKRAEHIDCLPDSVDYVILYNPDDLSGSIISEMKEIRQVKGIRILYQIDFAKFNDAYEAYLKDWRTSSINRTDDTDESGEDVPETFEAFAGEMIDNQIALYGKYSYDGINFIYNGLAPASMTEDVKEEALERQNVWFGKISSWRDKNPDAVMFMEGKPQNVIAEDGIGMLASSDCIILPSTDVISMEGFSANVIAASVDGVPTDRFVVSVASISPTDDKTTIGTFTGTDSHGNGKTAILGAGEWAALRSVTFKYGVAVENAQNDYYNSFKVYDAIKSSIAAMNPSPLN